MLSDTAKVCWMSHSCHARPLKELSSNHSNRHLSQRDALVQSYTPPQTMSISVRSEHTHLSSTSQAHTTLCVRERESESEGEKESVSKGHFTNAACQGGGEQHSNSSITTIKHTSNHERESERCHQSREGSWKEREMTDKEREKYRQGGRKKLYMLERDNYTTDMFTHQLIHWKNKIEKNVWFFIY